MYRYAMRTSGDAQTGRYVALVAVLVVLEAPLFDLILNKAWLNPRQLLGIACGIACVYLLNRE
jgi:drug/metabolite transporter (DMT)-like permease